MTETIKNKTIEDFTDCEILEELQKRVEVGRIGYLVRPHRIMVVKKNGGTGGRYEFSLMNSLLIGLKKGGRDDITVDGEKTPSFERPKATLLEKK